MTRVTEAYLEAVFFTAEPDNEAEREAWERATLAPAARQQAAIECAAFLALIGEDADTLTPESLGHDFWLTRNRHGAGFWDRGLGELGERLTKAAQSFGESDLYLGDDGQLYLSPSTVGAA
jgi:hypothetical protein